MAYKICIDPGHQGGKAGYDPGAVNGTYAEAVAALSIAKKVGAKLQAAGYGVKYTRTGDKKLTLAQRCKISNDYGADVFVSIHLNAAGNKDASGIETLRYPNVGSRTKALADNVQTELIAAMGWKNRGVKTRSDLYVLKHTVASAILIECGFISNDDQCEKLFNCSHQQKIANAIYKGIVATLKK